MGILEGEEVSIESSLPGRILRIELDVGQPVVKGQECVFFDRTDLERKIVEKEGELRRWEAESLREDRRISALIDKEKARLELEEKKLKSSRKALLTRIERLNKEVAVLEAEYKRIDTIKEQKEELVKKGALTRNDLLDVLYRLEPVLRRLSGYKGEFTGVEKEISDLDETIRFLARRRENIESLMWKQSFTPVLKEKIQQAKIKIETLRGSFSKYILTSPISGIVTKILKQPGETAGPRETIARVVDPETLRMKGYIRPELKNDFATNATVEVEFDNGMSITGIIGEYDPVAIPMPVEFRSRFEAVPRVLVTHIKPAGTKSWPAVSGLTAQIRKSTSFLSGGEKP